MPTGYMDPMEYGLIYLLPVPGTSSISGYDPDPQRFCWPNGLASLQSPAHMTIVTANRREKVQVTLDKLDGPPGPPPEEWEAVVEMSMFNPTSGLEMYIWAGPPVEGLRIGLSEGWVRVRVHAANRRPHAERTDERFLIQVWPAPQADEVVFRKDTFAKQFI